MTAEAALVGALALGSLFAPTARGSHEDQSVAVPVGKEAKILQHAARQGRPVPYDANVSVQWPGLNMQGRIVFEATTAPLAYDSKPGKPGGERYFTLDGNSQSNLMVRPIRGVVEVDPTIWEPQHPAVTAISHEGVISTDNVGHIPSSTIRLSDGTRETVAIAQTAAAEG